MALTGTPFYSSQTDLITRWGTDFVTQKSDLDGTGTLNTARVTAALLWADAIIDSEFFAGQVFTVGNGQHLSLGPISTVLTNQWAVTIAGVRLFEVCSGRGDEYKNNYGPQLEDVMKQIHLAASDTKNAMGFDAQRRWPVSNAAIGYAPNEGGPFRRY
jgi:phage gp36-like protein